MTYRNKDKRSAAVKLVEWKLKKYEIVLFTKTYSPEGQMCHRWLVSCKGITDNNYDCTRYENRSDCSEIDGYLWILSGKNKRESPHIFVRGEYLGDYTKLMHLKQSGKLQRIINNLSNFSPGASNYLESNKKWNLAHEADPDILPDVMLKIGIREEPGLLVKVAAQSEGNPCGVDCDHFVAKPPPRCHNISHIFDDDYASAYGSTSDSKSTEQTTNGKEKSASFISSHFTAHAASKSSTPVGTELTKFSCFELMREKCKLKDGLTVGKQAKTAKPIPSQKSWMEKETPQACDREK